MKLRTWRPILRVQRCCCRLVRCRPASKEPEPQGQRRRNLIPNSEEVVRARQCDRLRCRQSHGLIPSPALRAAHRQVDGSWWIQRRLSGRDGMLLRRIARAVAPLCARSSLGWNNLRRTSLWPAHKGLRHGAVINGTLAPWRYPFRAHRWNRPQERIGQFLDHRP